MAQPILSLESVTVRRGMGIVLENFDLTLNGGEVMILSGKNGAGKSTVIETAAGLIKMEKGVVKQNGEMTCDGEGRRAKPKLAFGLTLQDDGCIGSFTVKEHLDTIARINCKKILLNQILADFGLDHRMNDPIAYLSGGQRRKVAVISGLIPALSADEPRLVLLDEPDAGLDKDSIETLVGYLKAIRKAGHAILISTHDERLHSCADYLNDLESVKRTGNSIDDGIELEVNLAETSPIRFLGDEINLKVKAGLANNGVPALITIGLILAFIDEINSLDSLLFAVALCHLPTFVAGLNGDPTWKVIQEHRYVDILRAHHINSTTMIAPFVVMCIIAEFTCSTMGSDHSYLISISAVLVGLATYAYVNMLNKMTHSLARPNAVFIKLLLPITILFFITITSQLTTYLQN